MEQEFTYDLFVIGIISSLLPLTILAKRLFHVEQSLVCPLSNSKVLETLGCCLIHKKQAKESWGLGAGSGGLACAKEANKLGKKVAVADFVKPSPQGTKWGIGGTCLNVGCIPKKLMHYAAIQGEARHHLGACGWTVDSKLEHNWSAMLGSTAKHIRGSNYEIKVDLIEKGIKNFNCIASLAGPNKIRLVDAAGKEQFVTARNIVIAVGGRPSFPDTPNAKELCISSDDIFWLKKSPGKRVLCVGAGYISLECGGFLQGLGSQVTVLVRSSPLRTFDQGVVKVIVAHMKKKGIQFCYGNLTKLEKTASGSIAVTVKLNEGGEVVTEYDAVLMAMGRGADTQNLGLETVGINVEKNGKIPTNENDETNVKGVYALGDVVYGLAELTPVAIKQGYFLARRLYGGRPAYIDRTTIPTTVFTPIEYGFVGMSEEEAVAKLSKEKVSVYHSLFKPLEWAYLPKEEDEEMGEEGEEGHKSDDAVYGENAYTKIICDKENGERVIGLHYCGPNAGEVIMGFSIAFRKGITYLDLMDQIGIHPTAAEVFLLSSLIAP